MAIEFQHISKRFGDTRALEDVSLTFEEGKIYGLLGNNGAGKSTLLNILTGRLCPDSGTVTVDDAPAGLERRRVGLQEYFISLMEEEDQR